MLAVKGLPDGVVAHIPPVPDKGTEVKVELVASPEALAASVPIEFILSAPEVRPPASRAASFSLRGVEPRGDRLINEGRIAWLTVANKPAPPSAQEEKGLAASQSGARPRLASALPARICASGCPQAKVSAKLPPTISSSLASGSEFAATWSHRPTSPPAPGFPWT